MLLTHQFFVFGRLRRLEEKNMGWENDENSVAKPVTISW
jgi:hypothetical protein